MLLTWLSNEKGQAWCLTLGNSWVSICNSLDVYPVSWSNSEKTIGIGSIWLVNSLFQEFLNVFFFCIYSFSSFSYLPCAHYPWLRWMLRMNRFSHMLQEQELILWAPYLTTVISQRFPEAIKISSSISPLSKAVSWIKYLLCNSKSLSSDPRDAC